MRHLERVRFYPGTAEAIGRVALLDRASLDAGQDAPVQILLESPVVAACGDPFVIRRLSPMLTWGGGQVLRVGTARHRRGDASVLASLCAVESGSPDVVVAEVLRQAGVRPLGVAEIARAAALDAATVGDVLKRMRERGEAVVSGEGWVAASAMESARAWALEALRAYHRVRPWRRGIPRGEWLAAVAARSTRRSPPSSQTRSSTMRGSCARPGTFPAPPRSRSGCGRPCGSGFGGQGWRPPNAATSFARLGRPQSRCCR
ncbi:MAG: hypothetical protein QN163_09750 [Armatimonadota bacterium]|nr:hypothetical protein [Armatimonadota bacterium]MDR5697486.1 hypothetical protein [Armatimonadota bacterium]